MGSQFGSISGLGASDRFDFDQVRQILPQLVDGLNDAVLVVDRDRRVIAANRRYVEVFGVSEPVVGLDCHDAVSCPIAETGGGNCTGCDVLNHARPRKLLHAMPDASGALRRWEAMLNPIVDHQGKVTHVVEVWRDITDRSQLEGQLAHSERLASLGMLAAGVAHEINNPMASIVAGIECLERWLARIENMSAEDRGEAQEVLGMLERETQRSREITDKLLLLAQPYSGVATWVDLNRAGRDTLSLLGYMVRKQGITAVEQFDDQLPPIWGREAAIRGIWMNLCINAVQAMPEGGTLTLRTRANGERVAFEIEDTGPGIARQHLDRIWDPFFTTKPPGKGTGLGLSITQRAVERHGGAIDVQTEIGKGTRFIVELPLHGPGGQSG